MSGALCETDTDKTIAEAHRAHRTEHRHSRHRARILDEVPGGHEFHDHTRWTSYDRLQLHEVRVLEEAVRTISTTRVGVVAAVVGPHQPDFATELGLNGAHCRAIQFLCKQNVSQGTRIDLSQ
jgi:hypothetical protein